MRALIIDDSRAIRAMIGRFVKELGFEVVEAGNGQEGLDRLGAPGHIDIALVDWNMPVMSGIEFVHAVRTRPEFAPMRILMVTTEAETAAVQRALTEGANEYLMKPFTKEGLRDRLEMLGVVPPPHAAAASASP